MIIRKGLTSDEIREIFQEVLEDFKTDLIEELRGEVQKEVSSKDIPVCTSEVCRRWGRSRTTLSKLIKAKKLAPVGRYKHSFTFRTSDILKLFGIPLHS
jgi:hypothetical protein